MPTITFKTITQQSFDLELEDGVTIAEVKKKISDAKGEKDFPVNGQKLIYNGKVLEDTNTIGGLSIADKKFIVVMVTKKKEPTPPTAESSSKTSTVASAPPKEAAAVVTSSASAGSAYSFFNWFD